MHSTGPAPAALKSGVKKQSRRRRNLRSAQAFESSYSQLLVFDAGGRPPMKSMLLLVLAGCLTAATDARADDADFLRSFQGSFAGNGTLKVSANAPTVNISCTFKSGATSTSLSLNGKCRGLIRMTRAISADLKATGSGYRGVYIGSRTGPAQLNGSRSGNALNLGIRWAKEVNGDRK